MGRRGAERGRRLPEIVKRGDWERLIDAAGEDREQAALTFRDMAILATFLGLGIRCFELTHANWEDVDWEASVLNVPRGKGNKQRLVPVPDWTLALLEAYADIWPEEPAAGEPLFLSRQEKAPPETGAGEPVPWRWHPRRLSTRQIQRVVNAAAVRANLGHVWPHALRHSNATHQVEKAAREKEPLFDVQANLGHASLDTLGLYVHRAVESRVERNRDL